MNDFDKKIREIMKKDIELTDNSNRCKHCNCLCYSNEKN